MAREKYYAFECKDNSYSGKLFQFKSMDEARKKAADLAAVLFVYEYRNGACVSYECIDPFDQ